MTQKIMRPGDGRVIFQLVVDILAFVIGIIGWIGIIASYFGTETFNLGVVFLLFSLGHRVARLEERKR